MTPKYRPTPTNMGMLPEYSQVFPSAKVGAIKVGLFHRVLDMDDYHWKVN